MPTTGDTGAVGPKIVKPKRLMTLCSIFAPGVVPAKNSKSHHPVVRNKHRLVDAHRFAARSLQAAGEPAVLIDDNIGDRHERAQTIVGGPLEFGIAAPSCSHWLFSQLLA